jgi:hypothetical protein
MLDVYERSIKRMSLWIWWRGEDMHFHFYSYHRIKGSHLT